VRVCNTPGRAAGDVKTLDCVLTGHIDTVTSVSGTGPGSGLVLSGSMDNTIRLWNFVKVQPVAAFHTGAAVLQVNVLVAQNVVVYTSGSGIVAELDLNKTVESARNALKLLRQTARHNKEKEEEMERQREEQRQAELKTDYEDLLHTIQASLAAASPEAAKGQGKVKILPDRYRGMTQEEIMAIRQQQTQQVNQAVQTQQMETAQETAQKKAEMELAHHALLLERQVQRDQKEEQKRLQRENAEMAENQKAKTAQMNRALGRNEMAPTFFDQFNRDAR